MSAQAFARPIEILLVEDNEYDARLAKKAMTNAKLKNNLTWVEDGMEALQFLRQEGKFANSVRPDVILLDLNLPQKDGREVLEELKADEDLRRIPVVILTVSQAEEDILKTYDLHANCYVTKPIRLEQILKVVRGIEDFGLTIVKLSPDHGKS